MVGVKGEEALGFVCYLVSPLGPNTKVTKLGSEPPNSGDSNSAIGNGFEFRGYYCAQIIKILPGIATDILKVSFCAQKNALRNFRNIW